MTWRGVLGTTFLLTTVGLPLAGALFRKDSVTTMILSEVGKDYIRAKLPDGSLAPQHFVLIDAGAAPGTTRDASVEKVTYEELASLLTRMLERQNYLPAPPGQRADLAILVHWGKTPQPVYENVSYGSLGSLDSAMGISDQVYLAQMVRDEATRRNIALVGGWNLLPKFGLPAGLAYERGIADERYYVILYAYDFASAISKNATRRQWVTRMSILAQGEQFDFQLARMLHSGSRYFGRQTEGTIFQYSEGRVKIGELRVLSASETFILDWPKQLPVTTDAAKPPMTAAEENRTEPQEPEGRP